MRVLTKYEMLETREMNEVEIIGVETMLKDYLEDIGYMGVDHLPTAYSQTCINIIDGIGLPQGSLQRVGMVHNRVVAEVCVLDEDGEETEESLLYWFDREGLWQVQG